MGDSAVIRAKAERNRELKEVPERGGVTRRREQGMAAWTVGNGHGLTRTLACDVVDFAAMRGLQVIGQEADGSSEGVRVFQEGRDIPGNKDRMVTWVWLGGGPAGSPRQPTRLRRRLRAQRQRLGGSWTHLNSTPGMGKSGKLRMRRATSCNSGSAMAACV